MVLRSDALGTKGSCSWVAVQTCVISGQKTTLWPDPTDVRTKIKKLGGLQVSGHLLERKIGEQRRTKI
jgi:hypothetical protein